MRRRTLLRSVAGVPALVAASGCLKEEIEAAEEVPEPLSDRVSPEELDLPVRQRYAVAGAAIERAATAGFEDLAGFEAYLAERDVSVETLEAAAAAGQPIIELEYAVPEQTERGVLDRLGLVAGGFAALVAAGHESERLEATLLDDDGRTFGAFDVERAWAEAYDAGELTAREYAGEVASTAETTTH